MTYENYIITGFYTLMVIVAIIDCRVKGDNKELDIIAAFVGLVGLLLAIYVDYNYYTHHSRVAEDFAFIRFLPDLSIMSLSLILFLKPFIKKYKVERQNDSRRDNREIGIDIK